MPLIWIIGGLSAALGSYVILDKVGDTAQQVSAPIEKTSNSLMSLALVGLSVFLVYEFVIKRK